MTASYTYNQVGKPTALEYEKTTHCASKCVWFSDSVVPSIHGQWLEQASTLSHQAYTYDAAGRLTEVENTPAGQDCTARIYSYDEDSNRVSLTTRESSTSKCATEGGQVQGYLYDTGDRLDGPGTSYNVFDDITALPAQGSEDPELTSTYFTDNQVASQKQNKQALSYVLDPAGRTLEADATGEPINANVLSHYAGPGNTPAWTSNTSTKAWKRNITGIDGSLVATQNNGETPVLELSNLHGDIIATASASETATELASKADTSEFGVPTVPNPEKYAWLGAVGLPTELPSGVVTMGVRSYVPQLGRFLQPDPIPGGSANAYSYTFGDPVNSSDPTGDYAATAGSGTVLADEAEAAAAARAAAEYAARRALEDAANAAGPQYGGEEEWGQEEWGQEEWYEEEGGYEYASNHQGGEHGKPEAHLEPALLYQSLAEATSSGKAGSGGRAVVPLCQAGTRGMRDEDNRTQSERCARDVFLGGVLHVVHAIWHEVKHWVLTGPPETDRLRTELERPEPPFVDDAARDLDWGFDEIEFDW
jgi:RHS repeat-associated protein